MLNLEAALKAISDLASYKADHKITAYDLHRVLVALCGETGVAHGCATCEYEKRSSGDEPCRSCIDSRPKWEAKASPAQAIRVCRTCQYVALDGKRQPCHDCVKDFNMGRNSTGWTPKAQPAPKQDCKLEAGCKVIADTGLFPKGIGSATVVYCHGSMIVVNDILEVHEGDPRLIFSREQLEVIEPATPEVDDYVLWHERNRYGQIHYLDECDSNGVFSLSFAGLLDQPVLRKDFTIIAKARHQEQG